MILSPAKSRKKREIGSLIKKEEERFHLPKPIAFVLSSRKASCNTCNQKQISISNLSLRAVLARVPCLSEAN